MEFAFVTPRLAVGSAVTLHADSQALMEAGITHVVNCRAEFDDSPILKGFPISDVWAGVDDDGKVKPVEWFAKVLAYSLPALASPDHKVLCHCAAGIHRGPSATYAILRALGLPRPLSCQMIKDAWPRAEIIYADSADAAIAALHFA